MEKPALTIEAFDELVRDVWRQAVPLDRLSKVFVDRALAPEVRAGDTLLMGGEWVTVHAIFPGRRAMVVIREGERGEAGADRVDLG